jgi:formate/nitrite transporter FocA (FNT family)
MFAGFMRLGYGIPDALRWLAIAGSGNLIGGVGFVTLLRLAQVREKQRHAQAGAGVRD